MKKNIGFFFLAVAAVWCVLVFLGKLALSPTRHNLILLPFFCVIAAEGFSWFFHKFAKLQWVLILGVIFIFFQAYPSVIRERKDPFDENKILALLNQFGVKTVIGYAATTNLSFMPEIKSRFQTVDERFRIEQDRPAGFHDVGESVAFVSHREKLNSASLAGIVAYLQKEFGVTADFSSYETVYSEERPSRVEVDFLPKTENGSNGYFFYVLKKKI